MAKKIVYEDFFSIQDVTVENAKEKGATIEYVHPGKLHAFKNHPFKVEENKNFESLMESIRLYGIDSPIIVREDGKGGYEILSGHRRTRAAVLLGQETVPVIINNIDDDRAKIMVVDANKARERFDPSELAKALKMRYEAEKHRGQAQGPDTTAETIGKDYSQSPRTVYNYIKLNELLPELLNYIDAKKLKCSAGFQLAELSQDMQKLVLDEFYSGGRFPTVTEAKRIRQEKTFTVDWLHELMNGATEEKRMTVSVSAFDQYFSDDYSDAEKMEIIHELLNQWQKEQNEISL